ncbi:diguanylate cyclase [Paucimonas lemoignei]|uniref:diguanylate cyclase n=1 Tax=Paucimonas lemoignei TaxID=29443 RepID=A0A4R3HXD2_PAULE|nr:GGDEF domain-containing protein [Paucimonas lemoignei]TCS37966.1 diguanylate cyclase [Paucimonas lemoignei]
MLNLLHAPTLGLIVTMLLMTIASLMVFVLKTRKTYPGFGLWATGLVTLAGCFILAILRSTLPPVFAILTGNAMAIASLCLLYDGVANFYRQSKIPANRLNWAGGAVILAVLAYCLFRADGVNIRIMWASAFQFFIAMRVFRLALPHARGRQKSATLLLCAVFIGTGVIASWRFVDVMLAPTMTDMLAQDVGFRLLILVEAMLAIVVAFTFLLLTHTRIEEELHEARARAEHSARIDPLTGLWNRRHLESEAKREIQRANRYVQPISLVLLDIDHFKQVNDRLGHLVGDDVLRQMAGIVQASVRTSDLVCRWGGEEFAILMPVALGEAVQAAEKLRHAITQQEIEPVGRLSISVGCAQLVLGEDLTSWCRRADDALYRAKEGGRNRVEKDDGAPRNEPALTT